MAVETAEPLKVDLRLYNNLLNSVPQNAVTIPLILHCMAEQVLTELYICPPQFTNNCLYYPGVCYP